MKTLLFFNVCFAIIFTSQSALNLESLKHCCNLGKNYANSGLSCSTFSLPPIEIKPEHKDLCKNSIEVCCKNENQQIQCNKGIEDGKSNKNCTDADKGFRKDCCEACQLGRESAIEQESCQNIFNFGQHYVKAFQECCNNFSQDNETTTTTSKTTEAEKYSKLTTQNDQSLPPVENICDIGDVCAQICIQTKDSYKCDCNKGYTLMADGVSCKPDKKSNKKVDRCSINNPCDHICSDTGLAIKCSCKEGYELAKDKRTCNDIDECANGDHDCEPNEICINENGSYLCDDPNFTDSNIFDTCSAGYKFNAEKDACDDIDECEFEIICPRPKRCTNTIGSFICEIDDHPNCPDGFHYKASIESCIDIDECITGENDCNKESQKCLNTKGKYICIDKVSKKTCPAGFKKNPYNEACEDINECEESDVVCATNQICVNEPGGHNCLPLSNNITTSTIRSTTSETTPFTSKTITTDIKYRPVTCPRGYRFNSKENSCLDIDECIEDEQACDSNQECNNTQGSFNCTCKIGFTKDYPTGACIDINECQMRTHDCTSAQRCDNTIGSYLCARITGCGTGYTLNYANGLCEDDDECSLGTHNCNDIGPNFRCRNTLGSYRCDPVRQSKIPSPLPTTPTPFTTTTRTAMTTTIKILSTTAAGKSLWYPQMQNITTTKTYPVSLNRTSKKCLPGYKMNENGYCEDINECESNPCPRGQKCLNYIGRHQCLSVLQCKIGYELDDTGERCVDVNECTRGIHKCNPSQICKNGQGYYTCECPPGHHLNSSTRYCEDIDECKFYRVCSINAECINTVGSYKCRCKDGFKGTGNTCEDIDECKETARLCEHNCVNVWGTYRCACKSGFILNSDNRTCTDINECDMFKDKKLCIGTCVNIPGSYKCSCPKGYRLGSDGRTCRDIDECEDNICQRPNDICLNTRGGYKCFTIKCPLNYIRDPEHKGRCKRPQNLCDSRDVQCILQPEQYTYHYITLVSNLPIHNEDIQFFQIKGPQWVVARAEFSMKVVNVNCPANVQRVDDNYFKMIKSGFNTMNLYLIKSIEGPQEIELKIEMHLFHGNIMSANVVSHIFIVVSEYSF